MYRFLSTACLAALVSVGGAQAEPGQAVVKIAEPQYVLISFDNSNGIEEWKRSRALAAKTGAKFTYFLSCVFLLPKHGRAGYQPPDRAAGRSNIGFAPDKADIAARLAQIWTARSEGHEIGNHACGHFDGKDWSKTEWKHELSEFRTLLANAYSFNGIPGEPAGWRNFTAIEVKGFRAPYLSTSTGLFAALVDSGYNYDASSVSPAPEKPVLSNGLAHFALPQIKEGPKQRRVLAMDYNLFVRHSGAKETSDADRAFEDRTYEAFHAALAKEAGGNRNPLQLGFHFTMMNGGAYWRALERFASDVCPRADVVCTSYSDYLRRSGAPALQQAGG